MTMRMLVAGFGNVLRGDDGFGIEVLRRLSAPDMVPAGVALLEVGTGGVALAQALLTPVDRLIVVDAMTRGEEAGHLYVHHVDSVESLTSVDMHMAVPSRALGLAKALGALPGEIFLVGCEPESVDDLTMALSAPVQAAVERAIVEVQELLSRAPADGRDTAHHG